jgi:hypothetical protein
LCPRGRAAAIASDRRLQSWYVVVEFFLSVFLVFCFPVSSLVFLLWCESFGTGPVFVFENGNVVRVVLCRLDCSRGVCLVSCYLGERKRCCDFLHWLRLEMFDGLATAAVLFFL